MTLPGAAALVLAVLVLSILAALALGARRWRSRSDALRARLTSAGASVPALPAFRSDALDDVADPVARYLSRVIPEGARAVERAEILGLVTVVDLSDEPALARGALYRYLAEAVWFPTALLPGRGLGWEAVDATAARAVLEAGGVSAEVEFRFRPDGLVREVHAEGRPREVDGDFVPTPWSGTFDDYRVMGGLRIPVEGEVSWWTDGERRPYWRGRITGVDQVR